MLDSRIEDRDWTWVAGMSSLTARLVRRNIQALQVLPDGGRVAVARNGIYRAGPEGIEMSRTWTLERGSRPITLSADGNRILFGEYGGTRMDAVGVRIYCSFDGGEHFEVVWEFPTGDVHHVHSVVVDPTADHYWVLVGDHGRTVGIGALSKDFRTLEWVGRGSQMWRAVSVLCREDCLIYGSDSEVEQNHIMRLDKRSGRIDRVAPVSGSCLYSAQFGPHAVVSTCVEPSGVNSTRQSHLYHSLDDETWESVMSLNKDRWHTALFQFGTIVLPHVACDRPTHGLLSGQALSGNHDQCQVIELSRTATSPEAIERLEGTDHHVHG